MAPSPKKKDQNLLDPFDDVFYDEDDHPSDPNPPEDEIFGMFQKSNPVDIINKEIDDIQESLQGAGKVPRTSLQESLQEWDMVSIIVYLGLSI